MRPFAGILMSCALAISCAAGSQPKEELQATSGEVGRYGGRLVVGERAEPKTFNPVILTDAPSREVTGRINADLIHINRETQKTEPALAKSWSISKDGTTFVLKLRKGIHFSDGRPFDADDVLFTFKVYLDEKLNSPNRDLLMVGGKPIAVEKIDTYTVRFHLAEPYAAAERLFDSIAILPKHVLEHAYREGKLEQSWGLNATPAEIVGLGPFRLKQYVAGQKVVLERNPYYWKADSKGHRLPYLDEIAFVFVGSEDAQVLQFESGATDVISRVSPENFSLLSHDAPGRGYQLDDRGPSLEYNFLFFNLNDLNSRNLPEIAAKQAWFRDLRFRQAVSAAVDRDAIVRLVYGGRGAALWSDVTPGNRLWVNSSIPHHPRSVEHARELLKSAGFTWRSDGQLMDAQNHAVEFSVITSSSNQQRIKMGTLLQQDLAQIGINAHLVPLEFRAVINRVFQKFDYEACILGLGGGDADPNGEMNVWMSNGSTHIWSLGQSHPSTAWEAEIDQLMQRQMITMGYKRRKALFDRVQELVAENLPMIFLATPNVLAGAQPKVANFHPAVLDPYILWNVDEMYLRQRGSSQGQ